LVVSCAGLSLSARSIEERVDDSLAMVEAERSRSERSGA